MKLRIEIVAVGFLKASLIAACWLGLGASAAHAWGCKGHQTVALVAEKYLTPEAKQMVQTLLSENPVDAKLKRYCGDAVHDLMADASTWADDVRGQAKNGPWHYIDIPRGAAHGAIEQYCGAEGCVTRAIAEQLAILKDKKADGAKRADALRYLIHFVGDLHMPLHATTNNDEGGNCVALRYFRREAQEHHGSYAPNLHALWDTAIPERDMEGADPAEYAEMLHTKFSLFWTREHEPTEENSRKAGTHVEDWAWESHDLAESMAYGELTPKIPVEAPVEVHNCADANHIGERMLRLHIFAGQAYQEAAGPVVEERLAQGGVRLAMVLNEAAKTAK
jgi:hypothetical protein